MPELIIFGDSIIKGVCFDGQRYHLCAGHGLEALAAKGVTVQNFAKMGATSAQGLQLLEKKLGACGGQTTVLLCFGGNDCDYDWQAISDAPEQTHLPHVAPEQFVRNYEALLVRARQHGARAAALLLPPIHAGRFFAHITAGKDAAAILRWLGDRAHLSRWQEYYSNLVAQTALRLGCPVLDMRSEFLKSRSFETLIGPDGIHPTQEGHARIHAYLEAAL